MFLEYLWGTSAVKRTSWSYMLTNIIKRWSKLPWPALRRSHRWRWERWGWRRSPEWNVRQIGPGSCPQRPPSPPRWWRAKNRSKPDLSGTPYYCPYRTGEDKDRGDISPVKAFHKIQLRKTNTFCIYNSIKYSLNVLVIQKFFWVHLTK